MEHHHEHEHDHEHDRGEECDCGRRPMIDVPGLIRVSSKTHDEAIVISGGLTVFAEYGVVRAALKERLEGITRAVSEFGGVVGRVKASAEVTHIDMFSVTETGATVKGVPECEIKINLAAIAFLVPPDEAEAMVRGALEAVKKVAGRRRE